MIPHNAPSDRLDPRAPVEGDSFVSSVVDSVDSVVGGVAAEQNQTIEVFEVFVCDLALATVQ